MVQTNDTHRQFEDLARSYFSKHPNIPCEWRRVSDMSGGRTDVICWPGSDNEVFASLVEYQITVGTPAEEKDFENFGRGLSGEEIAQEAFAYFLEILSDATIEIGSTKHDA